MTDFVILTGFLGSGKTTLLQSFLGTAEARDTAVIVNEAGEIDIDGAILSADTSALPMAMLANGCVCCSIANDLLYTIEALVASRATPFRRIILETSGLARPGPIIRALGALAPMGMRLSIVATIDAAAPPFAAATLDTSAAQLAAAGTIVLTKLDRADPAPLLARLPGINPLATLIAEPDPGARALAAFTAPPRPVVMPADLPMGHPGVRVVTADIAPVPLADILEWLDNLSGLAGDRLLRLKGVVHPSDTANPMLFQAVGTSFDQPRSFIGVAEQGLVLIIQDLNPSELTDLMPNFPLSIRPKTPKDQKFFASFFQKRSATLASPPTIDDI